MRPPPKAHYQDYLADEERTERDQLFAAAHDAKRRGDAAYVEFGRYLREIRDRKLYREGERTWETFMDDEFESCGERGRQLIGLADLHDTLTAAGVEPVLKESHARIVLALPTPALQAEAVRRGREIAEAEGKRLYARHLGAAVHEMAASTSDGETAAHSETAAAAAVREVVRDRGGLHVVLTQNATESGDAAPYLPGRAVAPWDEDLELAYHTDDSRGLTRADLDEAAEFVWPVVTPDPWTPAVAWEAPEGPLVATLFPDRLAAPKASPSSDCRARTVLVAPGVDLLHPELPERVTREVIASVGADPARLYVFLTSHPQRVTQYEWPENAVVCLTAHDAASAEAASLAVASVLNDVSGGSATGPAPPFVLLLRDCAEPLPLDAFRPFAWVLLRGKRTKQDAYDSVIRAVSADRLHVGREVRANLKSNPLLAPILTAPRPERRAVPVNGMRDRTKGPLRPPIST